MSAVQAAWSPLIHKRLLLGKRLPVGHYQGGNEVKVVICLRTKVQRQSGECVDVVKLRGGIPRSGRAEYIGMPEDQEESAVSRLAEADEKSLRNRAGAAAKLSPNGTSSRMMKFPSTRFDPWRCHRTRVRS